MGIREAVLLGNIISQWKQSTEVRNVPKPSSLLGIPVLSDNQFIVIFIKMNTFSGAKLLVHIAIEITNFYYHNTILIFPSTLLLLL